jgi:hypothetical protein
MTDDPNLARVEAIITEAMPLGYRGSARFAAERILRALAQSEPFTSDEMPHVLITARFQCPCAAKDVILVNTLLPFEIDERTFVYAMKQWWRELKHEAHAHLKPRQS